LEEAVLHLKEHTGIPVAINSRGPNAVSLTIGKTRFVGIIRTAISIGNKSSVPAILKSLATENKLPSIIIAGYIPSDVAKEYLANGINYLDMAANCSIRHKELVLKIEGEKKEKLPNFNQARAFQEAGIKIIFHLLTNPESIELKYRELAQLADVSLGSVGNVMQELMDLNFILITNKKKILKNTGLLLERWVTAYHDVLRPRLFLKRMRFTNPNQQNSWQALALQNTDGVVLWGGEPAASELTNYISPEKFTIYSDNSWQNLMEELHLIPDENGNIEILRMFWKEEDKSGKKNRVAPLLIYADLMAGNISRNMETAKLILEYELPYIKPSIQEP
jgi:hypothetical protein